MDGWLNLFRLDAAQPQAFVVFKMCSSCLIKNLINWRFLQFWCTFLSPVSPIDFVLRTFDEERKKHIVNEERKMWGGIVGSEPAPFHHLNHSRTQNFSTRLPKLEMIRVPCTNHSLWYLLIRMGAPFGTWSKVRAVLNIPEVQSHFAEEILSWDKWKFYNLYWERLPLEPQQGMGMFSSTSAEKVPDLGSVERTQLQHHQRTQRHCQTHPRAPHSPPTALPEISKWTRTEQHHSTPFLHPKPHTWHFQGNFLRCRAELSALTSWAGFERRFKPAGVELNPDNPCSILFLWQVMLLQVGVQIFRYSMWQLLPTEGNLWDHERSPALPIKPLLEMDAVRGKRSFHKQETAAQSCTQQCRSCCSPHSREQGWLSPWASEFTCWDKKKCSKIATGSETRGRQQTSGFIFTQPWCNPISGQFYPLFNPI